MSQNIRILVIEDEKNIQNFITSVLNSQHYQQNRQSNQISKN